MTDEQISNALLWAVNGKPGNAARWGLSEDQVRLSLRDAAHAIMQMWEDVNQSVISPA